MFSTVITAAVLYIATAVDLLVILLIFFARANTRKEYRDIYIGQYLGSVILILVSLFLAFVLHYVPEKWVLGLLGLIPIYLGIKVAIYDDCEGEKRAKKELDEKGLSKLVGIVALVTVASCGADNIGLFCSLLCDFRSYRLISYSSCIFNIDFCFSIYSTKIG